MVSLEEMKQYLRIDYSDDDELITSLIQQAQIYIDSCCGINYKLHTDKVNLANLLIKKIVSDQYDNRGLYLDSKKNGYDRMSSTILELLSNCEGVVNE